MKFKLEDWLKEYKKALLELKASSKIMSKLTGYNVGVSVMEEDSP